MIDAVASTTIRRLPMSAEPAPQQLAGAAALLADLEQRGPALRWCQMLPAALLLGVGQRLSDVDRGACAAATVSVYRRGSGGGAVLGGADLLLLDLALPREHPLTLGDITELYRWLGEVWVQALAALGCAAQTVPVAQARADTAALGPALRRVCFGGLSPYEVVAAGRKVVGLAQIRRRSGVLFQAGIYLRWAPAQTARLIVQAADEPAPLAEQLAARVAGLDSLAPGVGAAALMAAFEASLAELVGLRPRDDGWSEGELAARAQGLLRYGEPLS